ncbi:hypothetical protein Pan14r_06850 [Crateriforma conspicua]|uniref:Uncharacterized protein n=1 Tax=Crateriforma conspicua TaxID=2527996 RepID=A0A5C5XZM1_9PLAN|nr:hypothetical protein Mal65_19320 [Crateriforma conspicua]TWT68440.1 hypothetical protein Pan14r_06850 [Crateriforma conspicua]
MGTAGLKSAADDGATPAAKDYPRLQTFFAISPTCGDWSTRILTWIGRFRCGLFAWPEATGPAIVALNATVSDTSPSDRPVDAPRPFDRFRAV